MVAACGERDDGPFTYDAGASLEIRQGISTEQRGQRVSYLTYASPKGGRVPALLVTPAGRGPFAGVIVQHGMPSRKDDLLSSIQELAGTGAVVLAIDAPFVRRTGEPVTFTERDRDEQVQLIVDLRRALDVLRSRDDVDDDRIGYLGYSYGAAMGGLLAGVETRIAAYVLMVGDGGLVEHVTGPEDRPGPLFDVTPDRRERWLAAMKPIEPLAWVGKASAPLLFLSARQDTLVPARDARRFQQAAPESRSVRWYESDHLLPYQAWCDAARFFGRHLEIAAEDHPAC